MPAFARSLQSSAILLSFRTLIPSASLVISASCSCFIFAATPASSTPARRRHSKTSILISSSSPSPNPPINATSMHLFLMARLTSPLSLFMLKKSLKFSCGLMTRTSPPSPSPPPSVRTSSPPISMSGLRRSSTDDGQKLTLLSESHLPSSIALTSTPSTQRNALPALGPLNKPLTFLAEADRVAIVSFSSPSRTSSLALVRTFWTISMTSSSTPAPLISIFLQIAHHCPLMALSFLVLDVQTYL
mmetsp:Transcript_25352/g.52678  ORF Transcript_25352/g.52678 Transcript_25352/m.52678 type:complete len:245 (-) Transcript_25352:248-982(-)